MNNKIPFHSSWDEGKQLAPKYRLATIIAVALCVLVVFPAIAVVLGGDFDSKEVVSEAVTFVPIANITKGTKLTSALVKKLSAEKPLAGAVTKDSQLNNRYAKVNLEADKPILVSQITLEEEDVLPITPGMRAVSIQVNATTGVEGYVFPGSHVDVVLMTKGGPNGASSKIIIQNAKVLSYGGDTTPLSERTTNARIVSPKNTVTLEVTPKDSLAVPTALGLGELRLFLRSNGDDQTIAMLEVTEEEIRHGHNLRQDSDVVCSKGTIHGKNESYTIGCDGSISQRISG